MAAQLDADAMAAVTDIDADVTPFDALWMRIYTRLADLCVDSRPAVRKSAGQTLFSMLGVHGETLQRTSWNSVLNKVCHCSTSCSSVQFPFENVYSGCLLAQSEGFEVNFHSYLIVCECKLLFAKL